jgi:hypothetical protein
MHASRCALDPSAYVHDLRTRRLLRSIAGKARDAALPLDPVHPIVRSLESGEAWGWCYVDQIVFALPTGPLLP